MTDKQDPITHAARLLREAAEELRRQHARIAELEAQIKALSGVQALSAAPVVTSEQRRLIGVIADKIEDGTLFQSGIYPKKAKNSITINDLRSQPIANQWVRKCGCSSMVGIQPPMRLMNFLKKLHRKLHQN